MVGTNASGTMRIRAGARNGRLFATYEEYAKMIEEGPKDKI